MAASPLFRAEYLSLVLAGRLARGCRAAETLRDGPWTAEEMTEQLASKVLDIRVPELHWNELKTAAGPVDVFVQPDGAGTRRHRVPGVQVVARVPFSGTPALLEAQPTRIRHGVPGTAVARVSTARLAPHVVDVPDDEGNPILMPLEGYVTFTTSGRTHDAAAWEDELGRWAEHVFWTTLDALADLAKWKPNAHAQLALTVIERRAQLDTPGLTS